MIFGFHDLVIINEIGLDPKATVVARWCASEEERKAALPPFRARTILANIFSDSAIGRAALLDACQALEGHSLGDAHHTESNDLLDHLLKAVAEGQLLLVPGWPHFDGYAGASRPMADPHSPERRLTDKVMAKGRGEDLSFEGARYVILPALSWRELRDRPDCSLQVVRRETARATISRMAERAAPGDEKEALEKAATMLADTNTPLVKGGLFLLQRRAVRSFESEEAEPAITPSMLKKHPELERLKPGKVHTVRVSVPVASAPAQTEESWVKLASCQLTVQVVNSYDTSEGIAHRVSVQVPDGGAPETRDASASEAAAGYYPLAACTPGAYRVRVEPLPAPGHSIGPKEIRDEFVEEISIEGTMCRAVQFKVTRKQSIIHNIPMTFHVAASPSAQGSEPIYELACMSEVAQYRDLLESEADKQGVDQKLVKAIVYMESTHGYYDSVLEPLDRNRSIRPMNVRSDYWADLGFSRSQLKQHEYNIQAGVLLLARLSERASPKSVEAIASLYNDLGTDKVSSYGMRVAEIYRKEPWVPEPGMLEKIQQGIEQFNRMNPMQQFDALQRMFGGPPLGY